MKKTAKQAVMQPKYRMRVVKAKKGKGAYCRREKHLKKQGGFMDQSKLWCECFIFSLPVGKCYGI